MFNIYKVQQAVQISHPLVRNAYIKKEGTLNDRAENIFVIDMLADEKNTEFKGFDNYLYDIIEDLENLKDQAEKQVAVVHRVDIRTH